jgi:hypothetical protein
MSCGTPVIAYPRGSIPELVEDGVSGFIVDDIPNGAKAVSGAAGLSRQQCRDYFERRFSAARMCEDYLGVYKSLVELNRESVTPSAYPRIITMPSRSSASRLQREEHGHHPETKGVFGSRQAVTSIYRGSRVERPWQPLVVQATEMVTKEWYSGWLSTYPLTKKNRLQRQPSRSGVHIPMPHKLAL